MPSRPKTFIFLFVSNPLFHHRSHPLFLPASGGKQKPRNRCRISSSRHTAGCYTSRSTVGQEELHFAHTYKNKTFFKMMFVCLSFLMVRKQKYFMDLYYRLLLPGLFV